jgi:hypothetical protein
MNNWGKCVSIFYHYVCMVDFVRELERLLRGTSRIGAR